MSQQVVHRPGPYKQQNKPHKLERGKPKKNYKGKCSIKAQSFNRKKHELNREERRNQLNQIRKMKREEAIKSKRSVGLVDSPPLVVMILSLNESNPELFLNDLISCDEELKVTYGKLGNCHLSSSRLKMRFTILTPKMTDLHSLMDAVKVSEFLLLLHSNETVDEYSDRLLSILMAHSLPTTIHAIQGLHKLNPKKKAEFKKNLSKNISSKFPDAKLHHADTRAELQLLLRQIGSQKQRSVAFRDARFHMLAEETEFVDVDTVSGRGTLKVSGYIRGKPLNVNNLVHIPGWGTYQLSKIVSCGDPLEDQKRKKNLLWTISEEPDPLQQESLQSEVEIDPMEGEQTWPTQEELEAVDIKPKKTVKKVAEGISDYQAAWIVESEDEESCSESEEESDQEVPERNMEADDMEATIAEQNNTDDSIVMEQDQDTESTFDIKDENYDKDIDITEEKKALVRFKEERMNQMFPDELDTPIEIGARVRFQKFRGLQSFKNSSWDPMENLPLDYARIYRFEHFKQTKKKALNSVKEGSLSELYVTIYIKDVPSILYESFVQKNSTLVVYGLLPHEQKMSVINTVIRKHPSCNTPVKSKDKLIFHIGYTRFTCNPIFSEHTTGNKFKYERFLPSDASTVASFYAPVIFPPAPVVVFRLKKDGSYELVATGSVLDVNPNRVVVKRVVLSGHPFRIFKRSAVVRYMFFNKDDINWFKCVELYTKCGRRGHIKESLGSHGHMKCVFDQQLQSQDVVLMSLYKRVYPKWTYEVCNPDIDDNRLGDIVSESMQM